MRKITFGLMFMSLCLSCGQLPTFGGKKSPKKKPQPRTIPDLPDGPKPVLLRGAVTSAFEVTVDGEKYFDMEEFYTQERMRLPEKVREAGYDSSWTVEFDAELGFRDLWRNMTVFLAPDLDRGYQATTRVEDSGRFSFLLPQDAMEVTYRIRANKRINVVLSKDDKVEKVCYNFGALDRRIAISEGGLPIVLNSFRTNVTQYECKSAQSGIDIPDYEG